MTDGQDGTISKLAYTKNTTRVYEVSHGKFEERTGRSASWRHNNPRNLKFEYAHSADRTVKNTHTREQALNKAHSMYNGVVDLDQRGNVIFDSIESGRNAQINIVLKLGDKRTVAEMLGHYSTADYSGPTHHDAQELMIYKVGDDAGLDLRTKNCFTYVA